eukprot:scaffold64026_cov32-Phaeocystis_antarctica.AAC.3
MCVDYNNLLDYDTVLRNLPGTASPRSPGAGHAPCTGASISTYANLQASRTWNHSRKAVTPYPWHTQIGHKHRNAARRHVTVSRTKVAEERIHRLIGGLAADRRRVHRSRAVCSTASP